MSKFKLSLTGLPKPVKIVLWLLLVVFAYALPLLELPLITTPGVDFGGVLFVVTIYCLVALGLNIVVGYAGLLDLGYAAFFAIGAYAMGLLNSPVLGSPLYGHPWSFWLCIWLAAAVSALLGVAIGAASRSEPSIVQIVCGSPASVCSVGA